MYLFIYIYTCPWSSPHSESTQNVPKTTPNSGQLLKVLLHVQFTLCVKGAYSYYN